MSSKDDAAHHTLPIRAFSPSSIRWETWKMQFELELSAIGYRSDSKKTSFLLRCIGPEILDKVIDWVSPMDPREMAYDKLLEILQRKFSSKTDKVSARLKLFKEVQQPSETVTQYISRMTQLFGQADLKSMTVNELSILLILRGISDDEIRKYLSDPERKLPDVDKLTELVKRIEVSRDVALEAKSSPFAVNVVGKGPRQCRGCRRSHGKFPCPAKDVECWRCERTGHYAKFCSKKKSNLHALNHQGKEEEDEGSSSSDDDSKQLSGRLNGIQCMTNEDPYHNILALSTSNSYVPPIVQQIEVNKKNIDFILDTGASISVVNENIWSKLDHPKLSPYPHKVKSYTGSVKTLGSCKVSVYHNGREMKLQLVVVKHGKCLIGRDWIHSLFGPPYQHLTKIISYDQLTSIKSSKQAFPK